MACNCWCDECQSFHHCRRASEGCFSTFSLGEARRRVLESAERADRERKEFVDEDARRWADYVSEEKDSD